jgi:uncharacterized protein (DUF58 family)
VNTPLIAQDSMDSRQKTKTLRVCLTGAGWGFLLLIFCELLMAVNFNNNLLFVMAFFSIAIMVTGYWDTRKNMSQISFRQWLADPVFSGQTIEYRLELRELGGFQHHAINTEAEIEGSSPVINLNANENQLLTVRKKTSQRGLTQPALINIFSEYPLGLFRATFSVPALPSVIVYPQIKGEQPLPRSQKNETALIKAEADTLSSLRRYQEGDRVSRIAWKASARSEELMTNEYDGADDPSGISLDWDHVQYSTMEEKISQLCAWVLKANRQGLEYSLRLPDKKLPAGYGIKHYYQCLKVLALYGEKG